MKYSDLNLGNFRSTENFNGVKNQHIVSFENGRVFQSYNSVIAVISDGKVFIGRNWDYSTTTGKYRNLYLGEDKNTTQKKINSGEYILLED